MKRILALCAGFACAATAFGALPLIEDFGSYADAAAFNAAWNASGPSPTYTWDANFGNPNPGYNMPAPTASVIRHGRNLGVNYIPTDAAPLRMSFDFYLDPAGQATNWNGARHYVELRGYAGDALNVGALESLVAIGAFNTSGDSFSTTRYQGRGLGLSPAPGNGWVTLDQEAGAPTRQAGWVNLAVEIGDTAMRFFVNNALVETTARPGATFGFDSIVLGSGLTAAGHNSGIDNLRVEIVPEPASLSLLALGALAALRRR